jgi:hypothetical protein
VGAKKPLDFSSAFPSSSCTLLTCFGPSRSPHGTGRWCRFELGRFFRSQQRLSEINGLPASATSGEVQTTRPFDGTQVERRITVPPKGHGSGRWFRFGSGRFFRSRRRLSEIDDSPSCSSFRPFITVE